MQYQKWERPSPQRETQWGWTLANPSTPTHQLDHPSRKCCATDQENCSMRGKEKGSASGADAPQSQDENNSRKQLSSGNTTPDNECDDIRQGTHMAKMGRETECTIAGELGDARTSCTVSRFAESENTTHCSSPVAKRRS